MATAILPENLIRRKPSLRAMVLFCLEPTAQGGFSERRTMLADQFLEAADGARTGAVLDELARKLWRAHAEGHIAEADAQALSESIEARRAALAGKVVWDKQISPKAASGLPSLSASSLDSSVSRSPIPLAVSSSFSRREAKVQTRS